MEMFELVRSGCCSNDHPGDLLSPLLWEGPGLPTVVRLGQHLSAVTSNVYLCITQQITTLPNWEAVATHLIYRGNACKDLIR